VRVPCLCLQRKKRVKGAGKGKPAFTTEAVPCESFFNFFEPPKVRELGRVPTGDGISVHQLGTVPWFT
jgi:hypothetical protein